MNYSNLLNYVTPHRKTLALIVFLLLAGSVISLLNPWIAGRLTESVIGEPGSGLPAYQVILLAWLALIAIKALVSFFTINLVGNTGAKMAAQLRSRVYEHLQVLPLNYLQDNKPGNLMTLLGTDAQLVSEFITTTLVQLLPLMVTFTGALLIMFWLDPSVAFLAVLLIPVYFLAMKFLGRRIRPLAAQWMDSWSDLIAFAQENLALMPAIKAFIREPLESRRFTTKNTELLALSRRQVLIQAALSPSISFLAGAGLLLLLWLGINHVRTGELQASDLVSLMLYAILLTQPVSGLADVYGQVLRTRGAAERLLDFFAVQPEPISIGQANLGSVHGNIEFRNISFSYPGRNPLFAGFNLKIAAGETVGLIGPNGAGKTTLVHLLMRFIDPSEGHIFIDEQDIHEVDISSLRAQIGLVAQYTLLLNGTVAENIAYGNPSATKEEIKKAAKAAMAEEFIEGLPETYDTVIGDQGVKLSGGQRQRLSLARTLLKNPPILILDEATSMLDPEGEKSFLDECRALLAQRSVILISHRPLHLELADRIIELPLKN